MKPQEHIQCSDFTCQSIDSSRYSVPDINLEPQDIRIMLISESAAPQPQDDYYASGEPLFAQTTLQAFADAGRQAASIDELVQSGIYFTYAVKCAKTGYNILTDTTKKCSRLLAQEIELFPGVEVYLLMGDTAIKTFNYAAQILGEKRVIPASSTYKLRSQTFHYRGKRVLPSYLQAGPSFYIEKSKSKMIAEDIRTALQTVKTY